MCFFLFYLFFIYKPDNSNISVQTGTKILKIEHMLNIGKIRIIINNNNVCCCFLYTFLCTNITH
jgi:hypothetical protein